MMSTAEGGAPVHRFPGRRVVLAGLALALVVAAALAVLALAVDARDDAARRAERATAVVVAAGTLERLVLDAQRLARGLPAGGAPGAASDRLAPIADSLPGAVVRFRRAVAGEPAARAGALALAVDAERHVRQLVQAATRSTPGDVRALASGRTADRRVEDLSRRFAALVAAERAGVRTRDAQARSRLRRGFALAGAGIALAALALTLYTGLAHARTRAELERRNAQLQSQRDELHAQRTELEAYANQLEAQHGELASTLGQLELEKARLDVSYDFGEAVAEETRFKPLADLVLGRMADIAEAEVGVLYVRDARRGDALALASTRGVDPAVLPERIEPGVGLAGRAAAEGRVVAGVLDGAALALPAYGGALRVRHELHVPLLQSGSVFGVVTLGRLAERPFAPADSELASHLAGQSAVALAKVVALRDARRREAITSAVLDAAPTAIGLFDDAGVPMLVNEPMRELLAAFGGRSVAGDVAPGEVVRDELGVPGDGRLLVRHTAHLDEEGDRARGRLVVLRDVTAEREAERLKDEFFALVSHELRTPLTSVIGYVELLRDEAARAPADDGAAAQRAQFLSVIERNARRLLRLVGDLLFVAQVEAGRLSLERRPVDLGALAGEGVDAARPAAARAGVELELQTRPCPTQLGDRDRLGQALDNLLSNAIKFTPAGGRVTVRVGGAGDGTVVEVQDTGLGMTPVEQRRLFERFYRARGATAAAIPGVGLGLSITRAIVEGHGGRIGVRSAAGEGTTFVVELPGSPAAADVQAGGAPAVGERSE